MEFDCFQPYFFDDFETEEDFYKSTAPSEDIWKKFELLPTPPMSPARTLPLPFPGERDPLGWLSRLLGPDPEEKDPDELFGNLSSNIIQDCMWSSCSASKQLEKGSGGTPVPVAHISVRPATALCSAATDCVDPAAVLTIPAAPCRKPASSGSESRSDSSGKKQL